MNEKLELLISQLYESFIKKPNKVLEIFNEFFGEEHVDMQGFPNFDTFRSLIMFTPLERFIQINALVKNPDNISKEEEYFMKRAINSLSDSELDKLLLVLFPISLDPPLKWGSITNNVFILVHFPEVRVTNEYGRYIDIKHLFAKIKIDLEGKMIGRFSLNRSEYTPEQFNSDYMHSHISHIPVENFKTFLIPCTGSGPINSTIVNLNKEYDFDLWKLFCLELSKFVETESIAGTPYYRLENIREGNYKVSIKHVLYKGHNLYGFPGLLPAFIKYFITNNKLKFSFSNNSYSLGIPIIDYLRDISNEFIKWYNEEYNNHHFSISYEGLIRRNILIKCIIKDGKIYNVSEISTLSRSRRYIGEEICVFKGNTVHLNITCPSISDTARNDTHLLHPHIALSILFSILYTINYKYGKISKQSEEDNRPSEKVLYL